jgi:hypothetical protein
MASASVATPAPTTGHAGPPLAIPASAFTGLFLGSLVIGALMTGGTPPPLPFDATDASLRYFVDHATTVRIAAFLQFGSAIPLGIFTATVVSRFQFLGVNVAGVTIALFGGLAASFFLAASALTLWVLSSPAVAELASNARVLQQLAFVLGGPGHVVPLGLLLAGISIAGGVTRKLPRWVMWFGVVLAVIAELSTLTLIIEGAAVLLPLARFPAFIWMLCVAFTLPSRRHPRMSSSAAVIQ